MNNKIRELQEQINVEKQKIKNCSHIYNDVIYDPETKSKPYGSKMVGRGSDVWHEPLGYSDVTVPRWSKECKFCGYVKYTYKQKPIITNYEPDF